MATPAVAIAVGRDNQRIVVCSVVEDNATGMIYLGARLPVDNLHRLGRILNRILDANSTRRHVQLPDGREGW